MRKNKMKKILALLLVALMCFPLVACGNDKEIEALNERIEKLEAQLDNQNSNNDSPNANANIIGTWERSLSDVNITINIVFNEDGTGTCQVGGSNASMKWKYSNELESYVLCLSNGSMGCVSNIETDENGKQYFNYSGYKIYRIDN
jgi:hypothetical protein